MKRNVNTKNNINNILVYATPFKITDDKWIGFCYGKRFVAIENPYISEMNFDVEKGEYVFADRIQQDLLPTEIRKMIYLVPLSNEFFSLRVGKEQSIEIIITLIEKGYDIKKDIVCYKHGEDPYQVCEKLTDNLIVKITEYLNVIWNEKTSGENEILEPTLYLILYKNL